MRFTRRELYDQIWSEPISKVAKHHEVSDSFLNRILKRFKTPKPPHGYWARLAAGKPVLKRPALPDPFPGDELEWSRKFEPLTRAPLKLPDMSATVFKRNPLFIVKNLIIHF